jgi:hypothetical protein
LGIRDPLTQGQKKLRIPDPASVSATLISITHLYTGEKVGTIVPGIRVGAMLQQYLHYLYIAFLHGREEWVPSVFRFYLGAGSWKRKMKTKNTNEGIPTIHARIWVPYSICKI